MFASIATTGSWAGFLAASSADCAAMQASIEAAQLALDAGETGDLETALTALSGQVESLPDGAAMADQLGQLVAGGHGAIARGDLESALDPVRTALAAEQGSASAGEVGEVAAEAISLGLLRLFAEPTQRGRGQGTYEIHVLFANLSELIIEATVDTRGNVTINNGGRGSFRDINGRTQEVTVEALGERRGRMAVHFPDGDTLQLQIRADAARGGSAAAFRVVLAHRQPEYTASVAHGEAKFIVLRNGDSHPVNIAHLEQVSESSARGESGSRKSFRITLSNGDVLELIVHTDHHGPGYFRAERARLNRFAEGNPRTWKNLRVSGEANGSGRIRIQSEGYDITLSVTPPSGGSGSDIRFNNLARAVRRAPDLVFQGIVTREVADHSGEVVNPSQGVWLVPDEASARLLNNPHWEGRSVELSFHGEIGGRRIDVEAPIVIRGRFVHGRFVPQDSLDAPTNIYVTPGDGKESFRATVTSSREGFALRIPLRAGGALEAQSYAIGGILGIGTERELVESHLTDVYQQRELATPLGDTPSLSDLANWRATPELTDEVARIIPRDGAYWEASNVVMHVVGDPTLVRLRLDSENDLFLRRTQEGGHITFEVLNRNAHNARVSVLTLGGEPPDSIEGILLEQTNAHNGNRSICFKPWAGTMSRHQQGGEVVYRNPAIGSLNILLDDGEAPRLRFRIPANPPVVNIGGLLVEIQQNGSTVLVFGMEDGRRLHVTLPLGMHHDTGLVALGLYPEDAESTLSEEDRFGVEVVTAGGEMIGSGSIDVRGREWIISYGDRDYAVQLDVDTGPSPQLRLVEPLPEAEAPPAPDVLRLITLEGLEAAAALPQAAPEEVSEAAVAPPAAAAPPEVAEEAVPAAVPAAAPGRRPSIVEYTPAPQPDRRFPWEEGSFILPDHHTRMAMRRAFDSRRPPAEGERTQFVFLGGLHSPDGETRARAILSRMRRYRESSRSFFEWILRVDMVFRDGEWVPNPEGSLDLQKRFPHTDEGGQVRGNFRISYYDGRHPVRVANVGTGWGIQVGSDHVIQPFRILMQDQGRTNLSPDFGLSLGTPTDAAQRQLTIVERMTGVTVDQFKLPPAAPISVDAIVDEELSGRVTPTFYDPFYRSHIEINGRVHVVEFAPGYSRHLPDARFTQLRVYDGNGFNWRLIFQHRGRETRLVGYESMGRTLSVNSLIFNHRSEQTGHIIDVTGVLPSRYRFGGSTRRGGIPFSVTFNQSGETFSVQNIQFDHNSVDISGMDFNPDHWRLEQIQSPREGQELRVRVTAIEGRRQAGGRRRTGPRPTIKTAVMVPDAEQRRSLAAGVTAMGDPLPEQVSVTYPVPTSEEATIDARIPMEFNERLRIYEPRIAPETGLMVVMVEGEAMAVECRPTGTGRNWRLTFPDGTQAYLGNFFMNESEGQERPIPVLWTSSGADPHRRLVIRHLIQEGLTPGTIERRTVNVIDTPEFTINVAAGDARYEIPLRVITKPDGRNIVVPTGVAERIDGTSPTPVVVNYYQAYRDMPAVIEVDGQAFEINVRSHSLGNVQVAFRRTHPGASAVYTEARSRTGVMLRPGDQSALLLVDLSEDSFQEEVSRVAADGESTIVRRVLWDAITMDSYEFVFGLEPDRAGRSRLVLRGVARLTPHGAEVMSEETLTEGGRIYVRLLNGHYLSHSIYPSQFFTVSSHGRTLRPELVRRWWQPLTPEPDLFSREIVNPPEQEINEGFYQDSDNRLQARNAVADRFGTERELIWDLDRSMPNGLTISKADPWDPARPLFRALERGPLRVEFEFGANARTPLQATVFYRGQRIPSTIYLYQGRPFLILGGPLRGVTFYWDTPRPGVSNLKEITHPVLREQLERDMGHEPMRRPRFRSDYTYPEVEGPLAEAFVRQIARSRLWALVNDHVLPEGTEAQDVLARILIPEPERFGPESHPPLLRTFEELSRNFALHNSVSTCLRGLATGELQPTDLGDLVAAWEMYEGDRNTADAEESLATVIRELERVAESVSP